MPSNAPANQQIPKETSRHHAYHSSHDFTGGTAPGLNVQHATPLGAQYGNQMSGTPLPGPLQSGRPGASASSTAPSTVPTLPQIQASSQQTLTSSRPSTSSQAHSYSRSSPAGFDQPKYASFVGTPESSKYTSPPSHKYTSSQTTQGDSIYSPLGLADIRPHVEPGMVDGPQTANPYSNDGFPTFPTNSNYLAPWAIYAFDWCKWPVQNSGAIGDSVGKLAIGSYVEDGHNFVGDIFSLSRL